jgi:hypothetical protein
MCALGDGSPMSSFDVKKLMFVQDDEKRSREAIMVLESNHDNLVYLGNFYKSIVENDEFPGGERQVCEKYRKKFEQRLNEYVYDLRLQIRRSKVLHENMASARDLVNNFSTQTIITQAVVDA